MGLFNFVKEAGSKLFETKQKENPDAVSPERINELRANHIVELISATGISVDGLKVTVEGGDKATLWGKIGNQADCEKVVLAAGNQYGVASVDCQIEVEQPSEKATFYTVESGDSLSKIAKTIYGDAGKYPQIFEANKPILSDPNKIYPGQVLRVPVL